MLTAYKIVLIIIIAIGFSGAFVEKDKNIRNNMTVLCIAGMVSFVVTTVWL